MALSFLKKGAASIAAAQQQQQEYEKKKSEIGKLWRFWLKKGEEGRITFVDGDITEEGFLVPPRFYEHNLYLNGEWGNFFVCPHQTMPDTNPMCPICDSGDKPTLVSLFTIIDHRKYVSQKGKEYVNTKKLLVAKSQSFEILNKLAIKRGGLTGCTFDVSRIGDKSESIGTMFDFIEKKTVAELQALYQVETVNPTTNAKSMQTYFTPADYEKEIVFRDADTLSKLLGTGGGGK